MRIKPLELRPEHGAPGSCEKAGLDEQCHRLGLRDRPAVEPLDRKALRVPVTHPVRERAESGPQPLLLGLAEWHQRATAALDEERRRPAEEHDVRSGDPGCTCSGPSWPRQGRAVRLSRVGRSEHEHLILRSRAKLAQPLHGSGKRELRPAETLDEVPATTAADRLEGTKLAVDGAVPPAWPSARTPSRTMMPCLSSRSSASARRSTAFGNSREASDQRPCVEVVPAARVRANRRGRRSATGVPYRRAARSGVHASFVTSPAHTSSHRAGSAASASSPVASRRSGQNSAERSSAPRSDCAASPSGGGSACGCSEQRGVGPEVERDPVESRSDPDDLARRT